MNKAKTIFLYTMLLLLVLPLASACTASGTAGQGGRLTVVTTVFPLYDFLRNVAGEEIGLTMLIKPGQDAHTYEPTASDARLLAGCDLFVCIGGVSDYPFEKLIASSGKEVPVLRLMDFVEPLCIEGEDDHAHESGEAHEHTHTHDTDEHIWTSPKNAMLMVTAIEEALCEIAPDKTDTFRANAEAYREKLTALDQACEACFSTPRTLIFGDRFPFLYLAHDYGFSYLAAFEGCSDQTEPSAKAVAAITDRLRRGDIRQIYYTEASAGRIADAIAAEAGVHTALLHSCHTLSEEELAAGLDYITLMERNLKTIREGG